MPIFVAGSLNLSYRKKAARQIDQDNKVLLDRLIRRGLGFALWFFKHG